MLTLPLDMRVVRRPEPPECRDVASAYVVAIVLMALAALGQVAGTVL